MASYVGISNKDPNKYVGPYVKLVSIVSLGRQPTGADLRQPTTGKYYPIGSLWIITANPSTGAQGDIWYLSKIVANVAFWLPLAAGTTTLETLSDTANTVVFPSSGVDVPPDNIQLNSLSAGLTIVSDPPNNKIDFTITSPFANFKYTLVTTADSPYTVLADDFYIATDSTLGPITLNFPNAPTQFRILIVKDRAGTDAVSNTSITTPGGVVTIDGLTNFVMNSNFQGDQFLFNGTFYEVFG